MLRCELLALLAGCGLLPPDEPAKPKPTADPDLAAIVHAWKVSGHVLGTRSSLSDRDASDHHGRTVTVGAASGL